MRGQKCTKSTCQRKQQSGGLCRPHYQHSTRSTGIPTGRVNPTRTREHILQLGEAGLSQSRIAEMIGARQTSVWQIATGHRKTILASTEAKILSIPIEGAWTMARNHALISAVGTRRRLQALVAMGHTTRYLAEHLGIYQRAVTMITAGEQEHVEALTAFTTARLFKKLQLVPGPSSIGRGRAVRKGWPPPLAWDEGSIDDPQARPRRPVDDEGSWLENYQELKGFGLSDDRIAQRMGIKHSSLMTKLGRLKTCEL